MLGTALKGEVAVLDVTGSIAAYKVANLASMLKKMHVDVEVIMAKNATKFTSPMTFESLMGKKCLVGTFDRDFEFSVEYVALIKRADVFLIAPASTSVIGKVSHGIADDMLTTTFLACGCHKIIAPAMNVRMCENPIFQDNLKRCESYGMGMLKPATGYLACGDMGTGKMPEPEVLFDYIVKVVSYEKDMTGKKMLVTAGPTRETIGPVRFTANHSIGETGCVVAKIASLWGINMTLVSGLVSTEAPRFVKVVSMEGTRQACEAVIVISEEQDIIVKTAAVADYRSAQAADEKTKREDGELSIDPYRTDGILGYLGSHKRDGQFLYGFSMETQNMPENSRAKLLEGRLDMIVANNLKVGGTEFGMDTNVMMIITGDEGLEPGKVSKGGVAGRLLDEIMKRTAGPT